MQRHTIILIIMVPLGSLDKDEEGDKGPKGKPKGNGGHNL